MWGKYLHELIISSLFFQKMYIFISFPLGFELSLTFSQLIKVYLLIKVLVKFVGKK